MQDEAQNDAGAEPVEGEAPVATEAPVGDPLLSGATAPVQEPVRSTEEALAVSAGTAPDLTSAPSSDGNRPGLDLRSSEIVGAADEGELAQGVDESEGDGEEVPAEAPVEPSAPEGPPAPAEPTPVPPSYPDPPVIPPEDAPEGQTTGDGAPVAPNPEQ